MTADGGTSFCVLSLDGGGSKGAYTLGVLREVEHLLGQPLWQAFDLIYGTSTGAIIGSLLALGESVDQVIARYRDLIPTVMGKHTRASRSRALIGCANKVFGSRSFDAFLTDVGIVSTHYDYRRPMIFKTTVDLAAGRTRTFQAGFGCTIAEVLVGSAAAFPFFDVAQVRTSNQGEPRLLDGGFSANNPTLFAMADAIANKGVERERLRVLSIGVGHYPKKARLAFLIDRLWPLRLTELSFEVNSNTIDQLRTVLFGDCRTVRVDETFTEGRLATGLLEKDPSMLNRLIDLGRESFGKCESEITSLLGA